MIGKFLLMGMVAMSIAAEAGYSSRAYVQHGLVYQLDGIRNVGHYADHDASVSVWKNLAGEGEVTLTGTSLAWGDNYFHCQNNDKSKCGDGTCEAFQTALNGRDATAEWAMIFENGGTGPFWMGKDVRFLAMWGSNGYANFWIGHTAVDPSPVPVAAGYLHTLSLQASDIARIYTNGVLDVACTTTSYGSNQGTPDFRLGGSLQNSNTANVKFYSLRFYDRALTAEEIALNANVDAVRFLGGTPAGKILTVTSSPVELGTPNPAFSTGYVTAGERSFAISFEATTYDDGVKGISLGDGVRYSYLGYALSEDGANPVTNLTTATSFNHNVTKDETIVSWTFSSPQYLLTISGESGVTVAIDRSTPAESVSLWCDEGSEHIIEMFDTCSPEQYLWSGTTDSEIADRTRPETTIVMRGAATLTASVIAYPVNTNESAAVSVETRVKDTAESDAFKFTTFRCGFTMIVR